MSNFLNLNLADFGKGLLLAVLSSVLTIIYSTLQAGSLVFDWTNILTVGLTAAIAYILKNVFTNSENKLLTKEPEVK